MALTDKLTAIADAIRAKGSTTDLLTLEGMVEAINAISAGGGGPFNDVTLLTTISAPEDVSAIQIDWITEWDGYDYIIFRPNNITFSDLDWLYLSINETAKVKYFDKASTISNLYSFAIKCDMALSIEDRSFDLLSKWKGAVFGNNPGEAVIYLYLQPYNSTTLIKSGSKIDILGVNFA